tara:strand:- start:53 stop:307 length:255 start_codon:yes stop_codon:yes gene_type:complete
MKMKFSITDGRCWYKQVVSGLLIAIPATIAATLLIGFIYLIANTFVGTLLFIAIALVLAFSIGYDLLMFTGEKIVLAWFWATTK